MSRAEERQLLLSPESVAVADLIESAVAANHEAFRAAGVALTTPVASATPPVTVDPDAGSGSPGNLLETALRHTPPGGTTSVDARSGAHDGSPTAVIEVGDSGKGLVPLDSERIFERFAKAPDSPGSGLGLAIARAIVEAHHGTLTARSDGIGKGARFTVSLLAVQPDIAGTGRRLTRVRTTGE